MENGKKMYVTAEEAAEMLGVSMIILKLESHPNPVYLKA